MIRTLKTIKGIKMGGTNGSIKKTFRPGQLYFVVMFDDEAMSIPVIQTLIFKRAAVREGGKNCYLFTEIPVKGPHSTIFVDEEDVDHLVLDKHALVEMLSDAFGQDGRDD